MSYHSPWSPLPLLLLLSHLTQVLPMTTAGTSLSPMSTPNPAETFVRLVGGSTSYQGRVEVYAFGSWGTVCDNTWDVKDAAVVCSMLGYSDFSSGGSIQRQAAFGEGTDPIRVQGLACLGSEVSITQCPVGGWGAGSCGHDQDAGVTCSSAQRPNDFLLITDSADKKIYRMDGSTYSYVNIPVSSADSPVAIGYDFVDGRVIWTDVGSKQIRSVTLSGTTEKVIWQLNAVAVPNGITVDPVTRLIFYTDTGNNIIGLMTIDGFAHLTIVKEDLDEPRAIVADSSTGLIYWCDYGDSPKIERASYDGSVRTPIVTKNLVRPTGIAINSDGNELFWCDEGSGTIEKSRLDGRNRVVLSSSVGSQYFGIIYFSDYLFFTDWSKHTVFRMNDDGSGLTTVGPGGFGRLNDIHYHRDGWGPSGTNGCSNGRGGCSHICLPNPDKGFFCVCPDGLTLQPDGLTCGRTKPCPVLFSPKYGSVSPSNCTGYEATVGTYCTVTCMPGFSLIGQSNLQCMSNGQWNNIGAPLICQDTQGPNITCPQDVFVKAPKGHETATVNWTQPAATDNTGQYVNIFQSQTPPLNLGDGVYTVTVDAADVSGITSNCVFKITVTVVACTDFIPPPNGYIDSTICRSFYGSTCHINCRPGYTLSGPRNVTCDLNNAGQAQWTSGTTCKAIICPAPPTPVHGRFLSCETPYNYQELCEQTCQSGFSPSSGTTIRRCEGGTWSGEQLVCTKTNDTSIVTPNNSCPAMVKPSHGNILPSACVGTDLVPGSRCTLTCDSGYQALSTNTLTCSSDGRWTPSANPLLCLSSNALGSAPDNSTPVVAGSVTGVIIVVLIIAGAILLHLHLKRRPGGYVYKSQESTNGIENPTFDSES
ncbi:low-density lipoprotein receptor-related protein 2-like [Haliotis rubra]|uniref:low-density lipoprotein receptor-related protein 2-like n=1 Tax=Haliotis rubra TaxID=36100 RepID=UPI001EE611AD|nr:low-density lipoprotein receptor-related protein 2-like [Haliotis rubra]